MDGQAELLRLLEEHRAEHPDGCSENDLLQRAVEFTVRGLRRTVEELEAGGAVKRVADGRGGYLVSLMGRP